MIKKRVSSHAIIDIIFFCVLCFFAWHATQGRIAISGNGSYLTTDPATLAAALAERQYPENFTFGSSTRSIDEYMGALGLGRFFLINLLTPGDNNYAVGILRELGIDLVLFYTGFYLLGIALTRNRFFALLMAIGLGGKVWTGFGTFWGVTHIDPLARTSYAALLGFLLLAVYATRKKPFWWPLIMLTVGMMLSIHPPNAIPAAFAIWLGMWLYHPQGWGRWKQGAYMLLCGSLFLLGCLPYVLSSPLTTLIASQEAAEILKQLYLYNNGEYINYADGLKYFFIKTCVEYPLLPLGAIGLAATFKFGQERHREIAKMLVLWGVGIVIVSLGVVTLETKIAEQFGQLPRLVNVIRGLRLLLMLSIIGLFLGASALYDKFHSRIGRIAILASSIAILAFMTHKSENVIIHIALNNIRSSIRLNTQTRALFEHYRSMGRLSGECTAALKNYSTPKDIIVSDVPEPLFIRFAAHRALLYTALDIGNIYLLRDIEQGKKWLAMSKTINSKPTAYVDIWKKSPAKFFLAWAYGTAEGHALLAEVGSIIWRNDFFILFQKL